MIEQLNPAQRQAVTYPEQHVLVLAGAGSGKTRVLTTRIAWLIQQKGVSPYAFLAVTFTNKAAREMLARIEALLPIDTQGLWVGTFHGLCNRLLRYHHRDAGLPQGFQILDSADQLAAIRRLFKSLNYDESQFTPRDMQHYINSCKEQGLRADACPAQTKIEQHMREFYAQYQQQCEREGVVDFAELLLRAYELLQNNSILRQHYQERFKHLLVDEFQDTNPLQYAWLTLLAGENSSIFAVGDDDQSIYAFRGADVSNMYRFEQDYARDHVIRLEQNYRSSGHILDAANQLIAGNQTRLGKKLWTDAGQGEPISLQVLDTDQLEAQWVLDEIQKLLDAGTAAQEIAVLYRSNAQSRVIEHHLFTAGIPYRVYGGLRFFERQEIKHVLAYLRLLDNPDDDTSWLRVVNFPTRGIGARSLEQLGAQAQEHNSSLYRAVPYMTGRAGSNLAAFVQLLQDMRQAAQQQTLPELLQYVIRQSGLAEHYQKQKEGQERLENLQELVNAAAVFVQEEGLQNFAAGQIPDAPNIDAQGGLAAEIGAAPVTPMSPLGAFLTHASLEAGDTQAERGQQAIQLMTVHAAKGLEFDAVFLTGLEEGIFPHERSLDSLDDIEEERRLMYVAMTRARQKLFLTRAHTRMLHGQRRYYHNSRFIDELPAENMRKLAAQPGGFAAADSANWGQQLGPNMGSWQPKSGRRASAVYGGSLRTQAVTVNGKEFRIGMGVEHPRFGVGTILRVSGSGDDAQAEIQFQQAGKKNLALAIAKLDIIAGT